METKFSIEDIQTAYKRFKSYVYYDNFNLHIRHKISDFESEDIDKKIEELAARIDSPIFSIPGYKCQLKNSSFQRWLNSLNYTHH